MAARNSGYGNYLRPINGFPDPTIATMSFWVMLTSPASSNGSALFYLSGLDTNTRWTIFQDQPSGILYFRASGLSLFTGPAVSLDVWYHIATTRVVGGTSSVYLNGTLLGTRTDAQATTFAEFDLLNNTWNDSATAKVAYFKVWGGVALTQEEIQQEMYSALPVRTANLYSFWPLDAGATERLTDYSGNAHTLTQTGTITDEDQPPVSWGSISYLIAKNPVSGGTPISSSDTGSGAEAISTLTGAESSAQTASGTDAVSALSASTSAADTGSGTEAVSGIATTATDTGSGADTATGIAIGAADAGSGTDTIASLASTVASADTASDADTASGIGVSAADSGSGADAISSLNGVPTVADTGSGGDAVSSLSSALSATDSATGADAQSVNTGGGSTPVSSSDTGSGAEAVSTLAGAIAMADSAAATESHAIAASLANSDAAGGADGQTLAAAYSASDAGTGSDAAAASLALGTTDAGTALEAEFIAAMLAGSDIGSAIEYATLGGVFRDLVAGISYIARSRTSAGNIVRSDAAAANITRSNSRSTEF